MHNKKERGRPRSILNSALNCNEIMLLYVKQRFVMYMLEDDRRQQ